MTKTVRLVENMDKRPTMMPANFLVFEDVSALIAQEGYQRARSLEALIKLQHTSNLTDDRR
jgi:hypothetical protein